MGDYRIMMQFDIGAERPKVLEALQTPDGVAAWWSDLVTGNPGKVGSTWTNKFPDVPKPFEYNVTEAADDRVEWEIGSFPDWWVGTTIRWDLSDLPEGPGTRLLFTQFGFEPDSPSSPSSHRLGLASSAVYSAMPKAVIRIRSQSTSWVAPRASRSRFFESVYSYLMFTDSKKPKRYLVPSSSSLCTAISCSQTQRNPWGRGSRVLNLSVRCRPALAAMGLCGP